MKNKDEIIEKIEKQRRNNRKNWKTKTRSDVVLDKFVACVYVSNKFNFENQFANKEIK